MLAASSGSVEAVTALVELSADPNARDAANGQTALMFAAALEPRRRHAGTRSARRGRIALVGRRRSHQADGARRRAAGGDRVAQNAKSAPPRKRPPRLPPRPAPGGTGPCRRAGVSRPFTFNELIGRQGGLTALHFAARQGAMRTVQTLVETGANVNQVSPADLASALLIATINGQFDVAGYLLEHGAQPNLASEAGMTPLYAVLNVEWAPKMFYPQPRAYLQQQTGYLDLVKALLDKGADPNARVARKIWYTQYNFDLLRVDESGATPFWRAAYASDVAAMKLLVAHGADPGIRTAKPAQNDRFRQGGTRSGDDSRDHSGCSDPDCRPRHPAAPRDGGRRLRRRLRRKRPPLRADRHAGCGQVPRRGLHADVNARDADGNTALHNAAARGDNEMIEYLVSKGADVTLVNRTGQTTVDMANGPVQRIQPYPETIKLLEALGAKNNHKCVSC